MNQKNLLIGGIALLLLFLAIVQISPNIILNLSWASEKKTVNFSQETLASKQVIINEQMLNANTRFGLNLFATINKEERDKNVFISPTSIAIALSMLYNGADGNTQQEIAEILQYQGLSRDKINENALNWQKALETADPQVKVKIANSLWLKQGFNFQPEFLKRNQQFYSAKVTNLDFANPQSVQTINNWVKEKTNGKIDKIVERINSEDILFLINAIYFQGNWTKQFEPKLTKKETFYLSKGMTKKIPLMAQSGKYSYYENSKFQAVALPYGEKKMSLYIFLPSKNSNLNSFLGDLTDSNWQKWLSEFRNKQGSLQIPRFKLEYELQLNKVLKSLGMKTAFDERQANFSAMTSAKTKVSNVKHKTFIEVNEKGTEASAATSVEVGVTSMPIDEPFNMIVNRPFFLAIRDNQTGTILFMGTIVAPQE
jgi:serpin B